MQYSARDTMASDLLCLPYRLCTTQRLAGSHWYIGDKTTLASAKFLHRSRQVICATSKQDNQLTGNRRSANYQPNLWTYEFLQSPENHPSVTITMHIIQLFFILFF